LISVIAPAAQQVRQLVQLLQQSDYYMGESARQIEDVAAVFKKQRAELDRPYIEKWVQELSLTAQWANARHLAGLE
jgi:ABC-type multidrug transport system ATPase subunit